jgi:hypothetical protein
MRHLMLNLPKYLEPLVGAVLVVIVVQYALITGVMRPDHLIFSVLQMLFYFLLAAAVFRGLIQRSRLAWVVVQIMILSLFVFFLLFSGVCFSLILDGGSLGPLLFTALLTAVLNGLLMGFLFSLPVCEHFRSAASKDQ